MTAVNNATGNSGVRDGQALRDLTEALIRRDDNLDAIVAQTASMLGEQVTIDAITVAAGFNGITRVADATGIPLDATTAARTDAMREDTGIQRFDYAEKTERYA